VEHPPFAGDTDPTEPRCHSCGAVLANDNRDSRDNPLQLCSPCQRNGKSTLQPFAGIATSSADHHELAAALLLLQRNLHPGESLDLGKALAAYGVELTAVDLVPLMRWLRRRGFEISSTPGKSGYELVRWRYRFRRRRHRRSCVRLPGQLTVFEVEES
jgi:ribosomal protein L34E